MSNRSPERLQKKQFYQLFCILFFAEYIGYAKRCLRLTEFGPQP
jgi:hypothetical protein